MGIASLDPKLMLQPNKADPGFGGYVRIRMVSGANPFLACEVVNDGGAQGRRTGDGAYIPARR